MKAIVLPAQEVRIDLLLYVLLRQIEEMQQQEAAACVQAEVLLRVPVVYSRKLQYVPVRVQRLAEVNIAVLVHVLPAYRLRQEVVAVVVPARVSIALLPEAVAVPIQPRQEVAAVAVVHSAAVAQEVAVVQVAVAEVAVQADADKKG